MEISVAVTASHPPRWLSVCSATAATQSGAPDRCRPMPAAPGLRSFSAYPKGMHKQTVIPLFFCVFAAGARGAVVAAARAAAFFLYRPHEGENKDSSNSGDDYVIKNSHFNLPCHRGAMTQI